MPTRFLNRPTVTGRLAAADLAGLALIHRVRRRRLTLIPPEVLGELRDRMRAVESARVPGSVIEAGCALGGSAIVLAATKRRDRPMTVHDVFGLIPPPTDADGEDVQQRYERIAAGAATGLGGDVYYGYQENLRDRVAQNFRDCGADPGERNVTLVEGLFQDTVRPTGPVALAHVDGDWYESVKVCLDRIWPHVSDGGAVVVDDYFRWSGCRKAVDQFLSGRSDVRVETLRRPHLIKV